MQFTASGFRQATGLNHGNISGENPAGTYGDKSKAIDAQQKAIEALKSKKDFSASEMTALESCLQQYRKM